MSEQPLFRFCMESPGAIMSGVGWLEEPDGLHTGSLKMCRPDSCGLPGSHAYYAIFQMAGRAGTMSGFDIYAAWNLSACAGGRNLLDFIFFGNESNG